MIKNMIKNIFKKSYLLIISILLFGFSVVAIYAKDGDSPPPKTGGSITNPLNATSFTELIGGIIDWVVAIGILIAVIMIIYSGILFMTSGGKEESVTKARKALTWSIIGLAVLLIGRGWIGIVKSLIGGE